MHVAISDVGFRLNSIHRFRNSSYDDFVSFACAGGDVNCRLSLQEDLSLLSVKKDLCQFRQESSTMEVICLQKEGNSSLYSLSITSAITSSVP